MSQDLFAAFGEEDTASVWNNHAKPQNKSYAQGNDFSNIWSTDQTTIPSQAEDVTTPAAVDDDDDFGDFEDASVASAPGSSKAVPKTVPKPELKSTRSSIANEYSTNKAASKSAKDAHVPSQPASKQKDVGHHPFAGRMDVLFEAGDDEYDAGADELADLATNPEAAMAYSKRIIAEQEAAQMSSKDTFAPKENPTRYTAAAADSKASESGYAEKEAIRSPAKDPNILFDADDLSEDNEDDGDEDDFDDFENGEEGFETTDQTVNTKKAQQESNTAAMDLLGVNDPWQSANVSYPDAQSSNEKPVASAARVDQSNLATTLMHQTTSKEEDFWDDFETSAPAPAPSTSNMAASPLPKSILKDQSRKTSSTAQDQLPPTNVPPPAVLLAIFPSVFAEADEALFNTIAKLDLKQKQMLLAHPASHQFLKRYLGHCVALARIIAGRKQRWKRDQRLSQSMRIGPAAAGGKGGMKLTGLDKSEVAKEDREVLDVLRLWKAQVGKLRTAVTAASAAPAVPKLPSVPEITDQMSVKTLKPAEGGLTAPQPCALCGLKREERVAKVDVEVDDSFGEWWVQGVNMHLSCRNFWDEFEKKLKSR